MGVHTRVGHRIVSRVRSAIQDRQKTDFKIRTNVVEKRKQSTMGIVIVRLAFCTNARKVCDNMVRLVRFTDGGEARVGVELSDGGDVADVTKVID